MNDALAMALAALVLGLCAVCIELAYESADGLSNPSTLEPRE